MGYKVPERHFALTFVDHPGLEVTMSSATIGEIERIQATGNSQDPKIRAEFFDLISSKLVSWNLEDKNDQPVPTTVEGIKNTDMPLLMQIVTGWVMAVARASVPKGMNLSDGERNGLGSLPPDMMEQIGQRLESLQNPVQLPEPNFS